MEQDVQYLLQEEDNKGVAVPGATFTLFTDSACTIEVASTVSADGETDTDAQGKLLKKGTVDFPSIPIGAYYMKETVVPESFKTDNVTYIHFFDVLIP